MSHPAFCTARALQADLVLLGFEGATGPDAAGCVAPHGDARLSALRFLASAISPAAAPPPDPPSLARFYAAAGLPSRTLPPARDRDALYAPLNAPARTSRERYLAAAFLRSAVDLAAAARSRRAHAPDDVDIDAYGIFTSEDAAADAQLAQIMSSRTSLFPSIPPPPVQAPAAKRVRAPLSRRDLNASVRAVPGNTKNNAQKPPRSAAQPPPVRVRTAQAAPATTADIARAARERADEAVRVASDAGVTVPDMELENSPDNVASAAADTHAAVGELVLQAEKATSAVDRFKKMASPLLAIARSRGSLARDLALEKEISASATAAYEAQSRVLVEIRARSSMRISYRALELWVAALPKKSSASAYCRQRSEAALSFTSVIEADGI